MKPRDLPFAEYVVESGGEDQVFDWLVIAGPPVIVLIAILGDRVEILARAVATLYIAVFLVHVLQRALRSSGE